MEVYSEIIRDSAGGLPNAPAVSIPSTGNGNNPLPAHCNAIIGVPLSMYYTGVKVPNAIANTRAHVENTANNLIGAQIPLQGGDGHYTCCEGQIVSRLFDTNPPTGADPLFPQVINDLIAEANLPAHHGGVAPVIQITDQHIVLVVLHIHSRFDPCAKCSKVLSGLSRQMNMTAAMRNQGMRNLLGIGNFAGVPAGPLGVPAAIPGIPNLLAHLNAGNARFLIEVSSNMPYIFNGVGGIGQVCSCAELAGMDANLAAPINIPGLGAINFDINGNIAVNNSLTIPNNSRNWHFPLTFPPYVVYGRVTHPGGAVRHSWCLCRCTSSISSWHAESPSCSIAY